MGQQRPYVSFAEVKEKVSLPDVLQVLGIADRFVQKGSTLVGVCPFPCHQHGPSPNPEQFKINYRDGQWLWHCFGDCQRGGDVVEFVKTMTGHDNAHVRFWFAEKFGNRLKAKRPVDRKEKGDGGETAGRQKAADKPPAVVKAAEVAADSEDTDKEPKPLRFHLRLEPEVPYLKQRGLLSETIERYGLGLCSKGVLKGYVAIPIFTHRQPPEENPVAYLGRWPGDAQDETARPRYRWPEGFRKSRIVYGLREALTAAGEKPILVTEGPFAVYHLVQAGFETAVAIFGSSLSDEQANILADTGRPLVLLFDGDQAGQIGMRLAAAKLICRSYVRVVKLPDGLKPDEIGAKRLAELLSFLA